MTRTPTYVPRRSRAGLAALITAASMAACQEMPRGTRVHEELLRRVEATPESTPPAISAPAEDPGRFAIEEALGAKCGDWTVGDPPMQSPACSGPLPEHVAWLIRNIPESHPFLDAEQREEAAASDQRYRAVKGYGSRPDFVAAIHHFSQFWVRSFEGSDPQTTIYVVYGPDCILDRTAPRDVECLPGEGRTVRQLKLYRVRAGKLPEDVTSELAPPAPRLTPVERRRYGVYLRPPEEGGAADTDIGLDVRRLATTPVMRWVIDPPEEGDYERPPIPDSDPRGFLRKAHFGFLVWTGERFELRDRIPLALWACGVDGSDEGCQKQFGGGMDPYLMEDSGADLRVEPVP